MHEKHLRRDPQLRALMSRQPIAVISPRDKVFLRLCGSIISQQLSTRVADVIFARFLQLFGKKKPSLSSILALDIETLRSVGLSAAKANYVLNVCRFFAERKLTDAALTRMPDDEIRALLIQIKGVGHWTIEMLLMFTLGREDVFAVDDLVIRQTMTRLYKLEGLTPKQQTEEMLRIAEKWRPYRTYACKYIWGARDAG